MPANADVLNILMMFAAALVWQQPNWRAIGNHPMGHEHVFHTGHRYRLHRDLPCQFGETDLYHWQKVLSGRCLDQLTDIVNHYESQSIGRP